MLQHARHMQWGCFLVYVCLTLSDWERTVVHFKRIINNVVGLITKKTNGQLFIIFCVRIICARGVLTKKNIKLKWKCEKKTQHIFSCKNIKKYFISLVLVIYFSVIILAPAKYAIQFPVGFRYNVVMWILFLLHLSQQNIKKIVKMLYRFRVYYFGFILIMLHTKIKGEWFWFLQPPPPTPILCDV